MALPLRLCLAVECTSRLNDLWRTLLGGFVDPLLVQPGLELALIVFGAHPPHSLAAVESGLRWFSVDRFRSLLSDLEFVGGGHQPVALAEALLEAASLFALPPISPAPQQHLIVCIASEPATLPVPWSHPDDCVMVRGSRQQACWAGLHFAALPGQPRHCRGTYTSSPTAPQPGWAARAGHLGRAVARIAPPRRAAGLCGRQPVQHHAPAVAPRQPCLQGAHQARSHC